MRKSEIHFFAKESLLKNVKLKMCCFVAPMNQLLNWMFLSLKEFKKLMIVYNINL